MRNQQVMCCVIQIIRVIINTSHRKTGAVLNTSLFKNMSTFAMCEREWVSEKQIVMLKKNPFIHPILDKCIIGLLEGICGICLVSFMACQQKVAASLP